MLPPKPKQFTAAHPCLDSENEKLFSTMASFPDRTRREALFFAIFESALAPLWNARASNHLHRIARQPEAPLSKRCLNRMAQGVKLAHDRRWGDVLETFIAISCDICAGELGKRAVRNRSAHHRVDTSYLGVCAALGR